MVCSHLAWLFPCCVSTCSAPTPLAKKLVFKVTRKPALSDLPTQDLSVGPISPLSPISPASPVPQVSVSKPGRFVFKPSTSSTLLSVRPNDSVVLEHGMSPSPRGVEVVDLDARNKKRELEFEVESVPLSKRRKEAEGEEEAVVVDVSTGVSEVPRKRWVPLRKMLNNAMKKLIDLDGYKFFYEPVTAKDVPDYFSVIKKPMDFVTMRRKLNEDKYPYWSLFVEDFELICQNCITFNLPNSIYWNEAKTLLLEGKKYLKHQATKINPDLLTPPPNYDPSSSASSSSATTAATAATGSASSTASNLGGTHMTSADAYLPLRTVPMLAMPKRLYLRNEDLPLHLLAPPPPVHLAKLPADATPRKIFNPIDDTVAKLTPQQQRLQSRGSTWRRYVTTAHPNYTRTHWDRAIPNYISYTRGFPGNKRITIDESWSTRHSDTRILSPNHTTESSPRAVYLGAYASMRNNKLQTQDLTCYQLLTDSAKYKFDEMVRVLRRDPQTLLNDAFTPKDVTSQIMDIDTSTVPQTENLLTLTADEAVDLKNLRATLASSHLDLSFLDTLFRVESNPSSSLASSLSTSELLTRNSRLIQLLNTSTQSKRPGVAPSDTESAQLQELTENLVMILSSIPEHTFNTSPQAIEQVRTAVELGLPSVPDVTPIRPILAKKEHTE